MENSNTKAISFGATILSIGLIACTLIGGYFFYQARALDNVLSVTGSAKMDVTSDQVKWVTVITRPATASTLKAGYAQMNSDATIVKQFYADNKIDPQTLTISPVQMNEVYEQYASADKKYALTQTFELDSNDIAGVTALSKGTESLIQKGVIASTQTLEYSYSKLPDLRVSLLADAVKDARARANEIVTGTGQAVGKLKAASSGVVQVLSPNSTDVSDYGSYDTGSIKKTIMVTVKTTFSLK